MHHRVSNHFPFLNLDTEKTISVIAMALLTAGCNASLDSEGQLPEDIFADDGLTGDAPLTSSPSQSAALDACEEATGQRTLEGCSPTVICSALDIADAVDVELVFDPLEGECPWSNKNALDGPNDDSNLDQVNEYLRARKEQSRDVADALSIPAGQQAIFCSVNVEVEPLAGEDEFRYDDDLLLVFGGAGADSGAAGGTLLMTRNASVPDALATSVPALNGAQLPIYRWNAAANLEISNNNDELFCLGHGSNANSADCAMPPTQTEGDFSLRVPDNIARMLGVRAALTRNYQLTAVVTGDNDPNVDCQHDGFIANVSVGYVLINEDVVNTIADLI